MQTLRHRVEALEASAPPESTRPYVAVHIQSARRDAEPWAQASVTRATCGRVAVERLPDEPLQSLCLRAAEAAGPWGRGSVPVVLLVGPAAAH